MQIKMCFISFKFFCLNLLKEMHLRAIISCFFAIKLFSVNISPRRFKIKERIDQGIKSVETVKIRWPGLFYNYLTLWTCDLSVCGLVGS